MPVTSRETRYNTRCNNKSNQLRIDLQKNDRCDRYEKRCALREEAKQCVTDELLIHVNNSNLRTSSRKTSPRVFAY